MCDEKKRDTDGTFGECISRTKICSKERMTRIARSDGWSVGKDIQLCPDCKKNKKQLKKRRLDIGLKNVGLYWRFLLPSYICHINDTAKKKGGNLI